MQAFIAWSSHLQRCASSTRNSPSFFEVETSPRRSARLLLTKHTAFHNGERAFAKNTQSLASCNHMSLIWSHSWSLLLRSHRLCSTKYCRSYAKRTFFVNLGNEWLNITPVVCRLRGAARDLDALNFAIDEARCTQEQDLQRTVIFFNSRDLTYKAYKHLQGLLPPDKRSRITFLHSGRTNRARTKVLQDFRDGKMDILCATEAAGMVCNANHYWRIKQLIYSHSRV